MTQAVIQLDRLAQMRTVQAVRPQTSGSMGEVQVLVVIRADMVKCSSESNFVSSRRRLRVDVSKPSIPAHLGSQVRPYLSAQSLLGNGSLFLSHCPSNGGQRAGNEGVYRNLRH